MAVTLLVGIILLVLNRIVFMSRQQNYNVCLYVQKYVYYVSHKGESGYEKKLMAAMLSIMMSTCMIAPNKFILNVKA